MKVISYLFVILVCATNVLAQATKKPNILMIAVDDLNDWTGYLKGHPQIRTPNLDRLVKQSVSFTNAFCNAPSCNPSRSSIMLGKHPNSTGFYSNPHPPGLDPDGGNPSIDMRYYYPKKQTLPQYFKANGYSTWRTGKIFHYWGDWAKMGTNTDDLSFDVASWGGNGDYKAKTYLSGIDFGWWFSNPGEVSFMDWGAIDVPLADVGDYGRATTTITELKKPHDKPFFMALGFYLPHLPWYYPRSLLNLPDLAHIKNVEDVILPKIPENDFSDLSPLAIEIAHGGGMPKSLDGKTMYKNWQDALNKTGKWKSAVQAYIVSIYFIDMQLGRVLDALESSEYKDNTIVMFWSDHGWMLGEKEAWNKYKPWEASLKVNYMIKAPGLQPATVNKSVELLSIFPTLVELAGIPKKDSIDGMSIVPLLKNPTMNWDHPVVTSHWDESEKFGEGQPASDNGGWHSVRDNRYRYIRYVKTGDEELYDLEADPEEWTNLINNPAYKTVKENLSGVAPKTMTKLGSWGSTPTSISGLSRPRSSTDALGSISYANGHLNYFFNDAQRSSLAGYTLAVYTLAGKRVWDFTSQIKDAGLQQGSVDLSKSIRHSGVYLVKLSDGVNSKTIKAWVNAI